MAEDYCECLTLSETLRTDYFFNELPWFGMLSILYFSTSSNHKFCRTRDPKKNGRQFSNIFAIFYSFCSPGWNPIAFYYMSHMCQLRILWTERSLNAKNDIQSNLLYVCVFPESNRNDWDNACHIIQLLRNVYPGFVIQTWARNNGLEIRRFCKSMHQGKKYPEITLSGKKHVFSE